MKFVRDTQEKFDLVALDLNDPDLGWGWTGGRLNINNEKRVTETRGARADLELGGSLGHGADCAAPGSPVAAQARAQGHQPMKPRRGADERYPFRARER